MNRRRTCVNANISYCSRRATCSHTFSLVCPFSSLPEGSCKVLKNFDQVPGKLIYYPLTTALDYHNFYNDSLTIIIDPSCQAYVKLTGHIPFIPLSSCQQLLDFSYILNSHSESNDTSSLKKKNIISPDKYKEENALNKKQKFRRLLDIPLIPTFTLPLLGDSKE